MPTAREPRVDTPNVFSGSEKPLLLLDVDGVLNPYAADNCPEGFEEHHLFPGEEPVRLCRQHGRWIQELAIAYEIVWASGWGGEANEHLSPLFGLSTLPTVPMPRGVFDPAEKVPRIDEFCGARATAWIDDMLTSEAWEWANRREAPTLLVLADPAVGLTREIVTRLRAWARALA